MFWVEASSITLNTELIRLDLVYGIGYGDDIQKAKAILQEIVEAE